MPSAKKVHAPAEKPVVVSGEKARQGNIQHRMEWVLIFSTIGAVIALALALAIMAETTVEYLIGVSGIMLGSILLIASILRLIEGDPDKKRSKQHRT